MNPNFGPLVLCFIVVLVLKDVCTQWHQTVYQKIHQDPEYNGFSILIRNNSAAKLKFHYDELTVFVPESRAFRRYNGELYSDLAFYHMSFKAKTLYELNTTVNSLTTVIMENPPLWITRINGGIYVNNAKILPSKSDYAYRSRGDDVMGKQQIIHVIDDVLNPMIRASRFSPNAYDFISSCFNWDLGNAKTVSNFQTKIEESNLQYVFKQNAGHTFFVPLDSGIDSHKFNQLNKSIILGHVIPYYVLFTRPTKKNFAYESLSNDDYMHIVISFVEKDKKLFVKCVAQGRLGNINSKDEFYSEIIVSDIPVKNGVVHLISKPLGIFSRALKPFPYLPIMKKISTDPSLEIFYDMGEKTKFNKIFNREQVSFTYFVPRDISWIKAQEKGLEVLDDDLNILQRHLILSDTAYSIEQLESLTRANNNTNLELRSEAGPLRIMVLKIGGEYYLKWYNKYINVIRPNYECTNGIVHILAGPMANFRRKDVTNQDPDHIRTASHIYWHAINKLSNNIIN